MYSIEERGAAYSTEYSIYFKDEAGPLSPWHDVPLWADRPELVHMVVEVPRWENAKLEICHGAPLNPMRQELRGAQLSFISNVFPHHGCLWNYGTLPQTWEDPQRLDADTHAYGDNDPIDVLELGSRLAAPGDVLRVKVLGALALVDEGLSDWKILAVDACDPLAERLQDVHDIEVQLPGLLQGTIDCFRRTKVPHGMPINSFSGEAKDKKRAFELIDLVHSSWRALVAGEVPHASDICTTNVSVAGSPGRVSREAACALLDAAPPPAPPRRRPSYADKWVFIGNM